MSDIEKMNVVYIDPDQRALYVAELPDGGFTAWVQKDKAAPRKLISKGYIKPEGYTTFVEAQKALGLHVSNHRDGNAWARWDVLVNGKHVTWDEYYAMCRGELAIPDTLFPAAIVTLANIEYRIATHLHEAYENILEVGHCLNEAKEAGLVPHGEWEAWVRRNTNMSERQAQRLMQAARSVPPGSALERLPISKIQAILALPEPEREPIAEKAINGGMSLRELQAAIEAKKQAEMTAKTLAQQLDSAKRDAQAYLNAKLNLERGERDLRDQLRFRRVDIEQLEKALEEANGRSTSPAGISEEAQAEIDRLKADLADAEYYAEQQAEQRQQVQREMLAMQSQVARGEGQGASDSFTASDLAAAVVSFLGHVGILPHMRRQLTGANSAERQHYAMYLDMVEHWLAGSRGALDAMEVYEGE